MRFSLYAKHIYKIENTYYVGAEITGSNNDEKKDSTNTRTL